MTPERLAEIRRSQAGWATIDQQDLLAEVDALMSECRYWMDLNAKNEAWKNEEKKYREIATTALNQIISIRMTTPMRDQDVVREIRAIAHAALTATASREEAT